MQTSLQDVGANNRNSQLKEKQKQKQKQKKGRQNKQSINKAYKKTQPNFSSEKREYWGKRQKNAL